MRRVTRHAGPWLALAWMVGTAAAVVVAVFAVNLAGSKVTTRPIASLSRQNVEEATAGDATVVVADDATADSLGTDTLDDLGAVAGGSGEAERSGGDASSGPASVSRSGSGSSSGSSTAADEGGGSGSGTGGSDTPGAPTHEGSTTTTQAEHESVTTTTAASSSSVSRSFSGNTVTVQCTGSSVTLVSTVAAKSYAKQVKSSGPSEVVVRFSSATAEDIEVHATCSAGAVHWDD